jgi:putative hydrolase of the HAD superfamily
MSMLDTVTFDVWNTLLVHEFYDDRVKYARIGRMESALRKSGFRFSRDELLKAYDHSEALLSGLWKREMDVGIDGHVTLFLEGLGLEADEHNKRVIRQPYAHALLDFEPALVEGASEALESLKNRGYRIGLISNTGRTPGDTIKLVLRDHGILKYFDGMVFSNEAGYIKPNRKIFEIALEGLGSRAENTVHVGDSLLLDVYGAGAAGMRTVLFNKYSERFEKYASRYYDVGGRLGVPDATIERLSELDGLLESMNKIYDTS